MESRLNSVDKPGVCCSVLHSRMQCIVVYCSMVQCVYVKMFIAYVYTQEQFTTESRLDSVDTPGGCVAVCCTHCVAVCYSELQCVAVCCSVCMYMCSFYMYIRRNGLPRNRD